jgi:hypothetical protein
MSNPVNNSVKIAVELLQNAFSVPIKNERDIFQYLELDTLSVVYKKEFENKKLDLLDLSSSISKMRSTYLPVDLVRGIADDLGVSIEEIISSNTAIKESRENTFMRMLGMPQSIELFKNTNIKIINSDGEISYVDFENMENIILNERQAPRENRRVLLNNIFSEEDETSLYKAENEWFSYCYLLVPPVQDYRISRCINESNKIVLPNFYGNKDYSINQNKLKTSLLEAIIRIRIDRLSGSSNFSNIDIDNKDETINTDSYGVIESLFIVRLRSAIKGIAKKLSESMDELRGYNELTGRTPILREEFLRPEKAEKAATQLNIDEEEQDKLSKQKIIEDSIMAILNDNSKSIDLLDSNRRSTIIDSHVMSPILSIVNIPRQRLDRDISNASKSIKRGEDQRGSSELPVRLFLGTEKGIGLVDLLVFILALFTLPEEYLTGLLSLDEYSKFFQEFYKISPPSISKKDTAESVDLLTEYILAGYNVFIEDLRDDTSDLSPDSLPDPDLDQDSDDTV